MEARRLGDGPIVGPETDPSLGANIQGPSLIRVPPWVDDPLGRFYLYFADHKGSYIRLAHADEIDGPWRVHPPGSLQLADSCFLTEPPSATEAELAELAELYGALFGEGSFARSLAVDAVTPHIASPDVHVDEAGRRIIMYVHGLDGLGIQVSRAATSPNGIDFRARPEVLGPPYLRAFRYDEWIYGLTMPGQFLRSRDGLTGFEAGPSLFGPDMRHAAVLVRDDVLHVFWTRVGDAPERILRSTIRLDGEWMDWTESEPVEVLRPVHRWEGADAPVEPSVRSVAHGHVNQLRDPAVFDDDSGLFLLYAVAGESGIALAELDADRR
jgi:hypothetical protein